MKAARVSQSMIQQIGNYESFCSIVSRLQGLPKTVGNLNIKARIGSLAFFSRTTD